MSFPAKLLRLKPLVLATSRLLGKSCRRIPLSDNEKFLSLVNDSIRNDQVKLLMQIRSDIKELQDLREISESSDDEMSKLIASEVDSLHSKLIDLEQGFLHEVVDRSDILIKSFLLELSCGVGGQEAMLFGKELLDVYMIYFQYMRWETNVLEIDDSDQGGINSAIVKVDGPSCYQRFQCEAGVHRVQRIPKTEKAGRIHTSTVTVNVLPVLLNSTVKLNPSELQISSKRSSGPGGQHVNKTESCAVVKHVPSGLTVECQESRHFEDNKNQATEKLEFLLLKRLEEKNQAETANKRKDQVASADRSEKIRTYNYVQDRITDHRINFTTYGIKEFMKFDLEKFQLINEKLKLHYQQLRIAKLLKSLDKYSFQLFIEIKKIHSGISISPALIRSMMS